MEGGWHAAQDAEITEAQRWTPQRADIARAYLQLLRRWQQRPWPTVGSEHVCTPRCQWFAVHDVVLCAASGAFHVCGDVCEHAVSTHEARVCGLTQRSAQRDLRLDPYDAPPPPRRVRYRPRPQPWGGPDARGCARSLLPADAPAEHVARLADVIVATWDLVQGSSERPTLRHGYSLAQHSVVVARLMSSGMYAQGEVCVVPYEPFMEEAFPSLKVLPVGDPRVQGHTRASHAFRTLLHGVDAAVLQAHAKRIQ